MKITFQILFLAILPQAWSQVFPAELEIYSQAELSQAYIQHFYPIGFSDPTLSEGSYFAFFLYKNVTNRLGNHTDFRFHVQDLVTDEMAVSYEFRSHRPDLNLTFLSREQESQLRREAAKVDSLEPLFLWKFLLEPIAAALEQYGIQTGHQMELESFPYRWGDELFLLRIETFRQPGEFHGDYWAAIYKSGQLSKRITEAEDVGFLSIQSPGLILSPFENRVVVLLIRETRGFEGPPNDLYVLTLGAHLIEGFKPWRGRAFFENQ